MNKSEMIKWLQNLKKDIGQPQHQDLWHYAEMIDEVIGAIEVSEDCISREWVKGICESMLDEEMLGHMLGYIDDAPSVVPSRAEGEWKWETNDICPNCGYKIPHLERIVGETVLMDSKDWEYCPNCGAKMFAKDINVPNKEGAKDEA